MRRKRIDARAISPRRPDVSQTESIDAYLFSHSLKKFADEYLRAALDLTVTGEALGVLNVSLAATAYMLRLTVEYGGEDAVLKSTLSLSDIITLDVSFPMGLPEISEISKIKAAASAAGFHFELRENRILFRTKLTRTGRLPIYATDNRKFFNVLYDIFFT